MRLKLVGTLMALAISVTVNAVDSQSCRTNSTDPYEPDVRMPRGKFEGQCIDVSGKRAIKFLEDFTGELTVANFRYKGGFYMAHIPLDSVTRVSFIAVDLNPSVISNFLVVGHTQLRIKMDPRNPIRLFDQAGKTRRKITDITDFLISYNYMAPKGVVYDAIKGLNEERFTAALQFYAFEDELQTRFKNSRRNLYEIDLRVFPEEGSRIVEEAVNLSEEIQYSDPYDSWNNNCSTRIFEILDRAIPPGPKVRPFKLFPNEIKDTGLHPAIRALDERDLLSIDAEIRLVNKDYNFPQFESKSNSYFNQYIGKVLPDILKIKK